MASLKNIKEKITGVKKTAKVTKAMESVSAVKMRRAQETALSARKYAFHAFAILKRIAKIKDSSVDDLFEEREINKTCFILISPQKGLAGGINTFLTKKVNQEMEDRGLTKENTVFICIGKKGYEFANRMGFEVIEFYSDFDEKTEINVLEEVSDKALELFNSKDDNRIDSFVSIYTNFITTTEQKAVSRDILPIKFDDVKKILVDIVPKDGKYSDMAGDIDIDSHDVNEYKFEPSVEEVTKSLVPYLLNFLIHYCILESSASEHSARMVAMKNATDKANDIAKDLNREYNKRRQAEITKEISEITSGMESVK